MNLKVLIIGCGAISQQHLEVWRKISNVDVIAVCDANEKLAAQLASSWRIPAYYTDSSLMLDHEKASLVDVCTPPQAHVKLVLDALSNDYHVLVEKPIALTSQDVATIMDAQRKAGKKVGVIHNWLFEPTMRRVTAMARRQELGEILAISTEILQTRDDPMLSTREHWCHSLPGGRFGEVLPHPIYILQAFLSALRVKSTVARKVGAYPWVPFDELYVVLQGNNGMGAAYLSFNAPRYGIFIEVYGSKKILRIDLVGQTIWEVKRKEAKRFSKGTENLRLASNITSSTLRSAISVSSHRWRSGHETYIRAFVDSIVRGVDPPVSLEEAAENVRLIEQIVAAIDYRVP